MGRTLLAALFLSILVWKIDSTLSSLPPKAQAALDKCLKAREKPKFDEDAKGPSFLAGLIYESNGQLEEAVNMFKAALEGCPKNHEARERLCSVLERQYYALETIRGQRRQERELAVSLSEEVAHAYTKAIEIILDSDSGKDGGAVAMVIKLSQFLLKIDKAALSLKNIESYWKKVGSGNLSGEEQAALHLIRAGALLRLGRFKETLSANQEVLKLFPSCHHLNGAALSAEKCGHFDLAESYFQESLSLNSSHANSYTNYGVFLKTVGKGTRDTEAIAFLEKAVQLDPGELESETGHAKIQLASLKPGGAFVGSMGRDYIEPLFDGFSATFDKDLVQDLRYVGHELVAAHVLKHLPPPASSTSPPELRVLDLGCGTGLLGAALQRIYQGGTETLRLTGVDVSSRMLAAAEKAHPGLYTSLIHSDVHAYLDQVNGDEQVDVVTASDVLIYIGDVDRLFAAVSQRLIGGKGVLCFTIEVAPGLPLASPEQQEAGYWLLQSGRFGHRPQYIEEMAKKHDFVVLAEEDTPIRIQNKVPVQSRTYCLQRK